MTPSSDTTAFTTRLATALARQAKHLARRRGVSLNQLVTEALAKELEREKLRLAREGYAHYAAQDALEAEEGLGEWAELLEREDGR